MSINLKSEVHGTPLTFNPQQAHKSSSGEDTQRTLSKLSSPRSVSYGQPVSQPAIENSSTSKAKEGPAADISNGSSILSALQSLFQAVLSKTKTDEIEPIVQPSLANTADSLASPGSASLSQSGSTNGSLNSGSLGGANTVPGRIASPEAATKMIGDVKSAGGGTLRIQMTHDDISDPAQMEKLDALMKAGEEQGVKVQFTLRDNENGGGGNVLTGDKLRIASDDMKNVVSRYSQNPSFVVDTFNEGGKSATQPWADMQSTLIQSARDAGYKGDIVVEDSNWGGGLTAGGESGLVKYAAQLHAANGVGNGGIVGSIHVYANGEDAPQRLSDEIDALKSVGMKVGIGEYGNANWKGGDSFERRDGAVKAVTDNAAKLKVAGATVLPWMDQYKGSEISHTVGFSAGDQLL